jgi:hypothetical protein
MELHWRLSTSKYIFFQFNFILSHLVRPVWEFGDTLLISDDRGEGLFNSKIFLKTSRSIYVTWQVICSQVSVRKWGIFPVWNIWTCKMTCTSPNCFFNDFELCWESARSLFSLASVDDRDQVVKASQICSFNNVDFVSKPGCLGSLSKHIEVTRKKEISLLRWFGGWICNQRARELLLGVHPRLLIIGSHSSWSLGDRSQPSRRLRSLPKTIEEPWISYVRMCTKYQIAWMRRQVKLMNDGKLERIMNH